MFWDTYNAIFNMCFSIIKVRNAPLYNCIMIFGDVDFPQKKRDDGEVGCSICSLAELEMARLATCWKFSR